MIQWHANVVSKRRTNKAEQRYEIHNIVRHQKGRTGNSMRKNLKQQLFLLILSAVWTFRYVKHQSGQPPDITAKWSCTSGSLDDRGEKRRDRRNAAGSFYLPCMEIRTAIRTACKLSAQCLYNILGCVAACFDQNARRICRASDHLFLLLVLNGYNRSCNESVSMNPIVHKAIFALLHTPPPDYCALRPSHQMHRRDICHESRDTGTDGHVALNSSHSIL